MKLTIFLELENMPKPPHLNLKKQTIFSHIQQIYQFYGDFLGLRLARKHIFWCATNLDKKHAQRFWQSINRGTLKKKIQRYKLLTLYNCFLTTCQILKE